MAGPILVRDESVVVRIYRQKAPSTKAGHTNIVTWVGPEGRQKHSEADDKEALRWAKQKAAELAGGIHSGASRSDLIELAEARRMAGETGLLAALAEWKQAKLAAAPVREEVGYDEALRRFVDAKKALGGEASTYDYKLEAVGKHLPKKLLGEISVEEWTKALSSTPHPVTRNDRRKRLVTFCRWCQRQGLLPDNVRPSIERTDLAKEPATTIGILTPKAYRALLVWTRKEHPDKLAAVVLAGFCGLRIDELHGKRHDNALRQRWEHVRDSEGFLSVSAAKENTADNRLVDLCPAALAWLRVCGPRGEYVCDPGCLDWFRRLALLAGHQWPANGLRHSFITYRIALTGDKAHTATQAGTSVKQIDKHYRVPLPKAAGEAWWGLRP